MPELLSPVGPLFGPNYVTVSVELKDDEKADDQPSSYQLQIFPDAMNPELKAAGLRTQYYFQPARIHLARLVESKKYAFGMYIFKGLLNTTPIGDTHQDEVEVGGGWCTFTTTSAVPDAVLKAAQKSLMERNHDKPKRAAAEKYFNYNAEDSMPEPDLGMVPVSKSNVSIEVPNFSTVNETPIPDVDEKPKILMTISAQGTGKGSIEAQGFNSFLVSCNQLAAGAIAGSLKARVSPFTVRSLLEEEFYIHKVTVEVTANAKKIYNAFSFALNAGGFLGINTLTASAAYERCLAEQAITTKIVSGDVDDETHEWILKQAEAMKTFVMDMVKKQIFDWTPTTSTEAAVSSDRGWFSNLFGGAIVSLKANFQEHEFESSDFLTLEGAVSREHSLSGELLEFEKLSDAEIADYIHVSEIDEFTQKIQISATCNIAFQKEGEEAESGWSPPNDPINSVVFEASYPDTAEPGSNGQFAPDVRVNGPYTLIGSAEMKKGVGPTTWTRENKNAAFLLSWYRIGPNDTWPPDQVKIRQKISFNSKDPRVKLKSDDGVYELVKLTTDHIPILGLAEVGYTRIKFVLDRVLRSSAITGFLWLKFGDIEHDGLPIDAENQKRLIFELYSNRYEKVTKLEYQLTLLIQGAFTDPVIELVGPKEDFALPEGLLKTATCRLRTPDVPAKDVARATEYIKAAEAAL